MIIKLCKFCCRREVRDLQGEKKRICWHQPHNLRSQYQGSHDQVRDQRLMRLWSDIWHYPCHVSVTFVVAETPSERRKRLSPFRFTVGFHNLWCFLWCFRHGSIESDSNKWDTDQSKLSIADDGPVTQLHEEEEIIFSNPQNNHPTLEIIEIEIPKLPERNREHKYSDSLSNFDEFQIKVCIV